MIIMSDQYPIGALVRCKVKKGSYQDLQFDDIGEVIEDPFVYVTVWWPRIKKVLLMKFSEIIPISPQS